MRRPPRYTQSDTLLPCTAFFLSSAASINSDAPVRARLELSGVIVAGACGAMAAVSDASIALDTTAGGASDVVSDDPQRCSSRTAPTMKIGRESCRERVCQYV